MVLHAEGYCSIAFQGGEPTLCGLDFYKKMIEYARKYNRRGIPLTFAFQTNGTNLTEEWCHFFKENHFLVGISLDGTRENHDRYRHFRNGEGTFEQVREACKMLEKYGVDYNILTVVHRQTAEQIPQIYQYYKKKNLNYQQYIMCLDPLDEEPGQMEYSLVPEKFGQFMTELFDCWYEDWKRGTPPYIRQFDNYIGILQGYPPEACDQRGNCGIQYVVEADGGVYPCDFYVLDEYCLGNVNENTIAQMDQKRTEIGFLERSMRLSQECRACPYLMLCRSGCQRCRTEGTDHTYQNYFCKGYKQFFEACLPRMKEMAGADKGLGGM